MASTWNCGTAAGPGARIRCAKDTGLRNLPLHGYDQNQVWCEIVALACELLAWMAMLALPGTARR
jgi:Transposase DDE domain group 1